MITIDDARAAVRTLVPPLPVRLAVLADTPGATLAEPLLAATALPSVDIAAMDGYAVCGEGPWLIRARVQTAASGAVMALQPGQAMRIGTGAQVPDGTGAVLRDEYTTRTTARGQAELHRRAGSPVRDDTRRQGKDWSKGDELAATGQRVCPAMVSAAAAAETSVMLIRGRPRAHVVLTGNENDTGNTLGRGQGRDSIGPVIAQYLHHVDIDCVTVSYCPDDASRLVDELTHLPRTDIVVVVGAARFGPANHLRHALAQVGAHTILNGLPCRPGGTQMIATVPHGPVVHCLPGNPYAALAALLIMTPAIVDALTARTPRPRRLIELEQAPALATPTLTRVLPVTQTADGSWQADQSVSTSHVAGLMNRHGLVLIPPRAETISHRTIEMLTLPT